MTFLVRSAALVLPFDGVMPRFAGPVHRCGMLASILGKAEIGRGAIVADHAVIRADGHFVRLGDDFCLGVGSTVHIAHGLYPAIVGDRVAVGANAVVHACTVAGDVVVEDGVVVLDGSVVDSDCVIEAGSTVFPRSRLAGGFVYAGSPAKPVRPLRSGERAERYERVRAAAYVSEEWVLPALASGPNFIAQTATVIGDVRLAARASVFFGCRLDAGPATIVVGENTNVQDNTVIRAGDGVVIGHDTTIGHNVRLHGCRIGEAVLIGMGATLEPGCVVEDDVLLAAGATTLPGQHLESGWLWGGRPARPLARLDAARRTMMRDTISHYCDYAEAFRLAQQTLGARAVAVLSPD